MNRHDEIKSLLSASRKMLSNESLNEHVLQIKKNYGLLTEEEYETASSGDDVVDKVNVAKSVESETEKAQKKNEDEQSQKYRISGGIMVIHGDSKSELELTTDEKMAFQETMDEFVNEVSDLVDFNPIKIYKTNVEWSGKIIDFDVEFFFSIGEENGIYLNGEMIKTDEKFLDLVTKLKTYYEKFKSKWAKVLASRKKTESKKQNEE